MDDTEKFRRFDAIHRTKRVYDGIRKDMELRCVDAMMGVLARRNGGQEENGFHTAILLGNPPDDRDLRGSGVMINNITSSVNKACFRFMNDSEGNPRISGIDIHMTDGRCRCVYGTNRYGRKVRHDMDLLTDLAIEMLNNRHQVTDTE